MAVQLKIDDMLAVLERALPASRPLYDQFLQEAEDLANRMGKTVVMMVPGVTVGTASFEGEAFGGLCCPFYPNDANDPIPDLFLGLDDEGWEDPGIGHYPISTGDENG